MNAASSPAPGRMCHGGGPPSTVTLGSHAARSISGFANDVQFQSTRTPDRRESRGCRSARRGGTASCLQLLRRRRHARSGRGCVRASRRLAGRVRGTAPDPPRRCASARRALRRTPSPVWCSGGGFAAESSSSVDRTASIRVWLQAGAQSAALRSSIASTGRTPSSSQPSSRGMNKPVKAGVDLMLATQPVGHVLGFRRFDEDRSAVGELDDKPVGGRVTTAFAAVRDGARPVARSIRSLSSVIAPDEARGSPVRSSSAAAR